MSQIDLSQYNIDEKFGFLPRFPVEKFRDTKTNAHLALLDSFVEVAYTHSTKTILSFIHALPRFTLNPTKMSDGEKRRAMMLLLFMQSFSVRLDKTVETSDGAYVVPDKLALPLMQLYQDRGNMFETRPHMVSYTSGVLDNWYLKDKKQGFSLENIEPFICFTDKEDERNFISLHVLYEYAGRNIPTLAFLVRDTLKKNTLSEDELYQAEQYVRHIASSIDSMRLCFTTLPRVCSPAVYHEYIRPWFSSLGQLSYGSFDTTFTAKHVPGGSSAAQSPLLPFIDAFLEIEHASNNTLETREEILPTHARAMKDIASSQIRKTGMKYTRIRRVYNSCIATVVAFRMEHQRIIREYIPTECKGTGGSHIDTWLSRQIDDTERAYIT